MDPETLHLLEEELARFNNSVFDNVTFQVSNVTPNLTIGNFSQMSDLEYWIRTISFWLLRTMLIPTGWLFRDLKIFLVPLDKGMCVHFLWKLSVAYIYFLFKFWLNLFEYIVMIYIRYVYVTYIKCLQSDPDSSVR